MSNVPQQIGNYILDRQIGRGASSEVWLAHHMHLHQRQVAIKLLMSRAQEAIARFSREASIAARLQHPNVVRLYDHGTYPPAFQCSIFQYVEGGSLAQFLERQERVEPSHALSIFRDIAEALDYAHGLDVVHRDVSPGNILLEQSGKRAYLTDFGIAREPQTSLTTVSAIMGTPGYWSPEHLQSATAVTRLSDLFSLGVVLYVMLSGKMPWDDPPNSPRSIFPPPMPLKQRGVKHLPDTIDRVFLTMLATDPAKRYPTGKAAFDDLERIFARHTGVTEISHGKSKPRKSHEEDDEEIVRLEAGDVEFDDVEHALGPDCVRAPMVAAQERAARLLRPQVVAELLDDWSSQGRLRRRLIGRLAKVQQARSYNIYFYQLKLLYEQRDAPNTVEEPDTEDKKPEIEPVLDRWQVPLPQPQNFSDIAGGTATIPGSSRVATCGRCKGRGIILCPECRGTRRIKVLQPAETAPAADTMRSRNLGMSTSTGIAAAPQQDVEVEIACPRCEGLGGIQCERCAGVGRLFQHQVFNWSRWAWHDTTRNELNNEQHLPTLMNCEQQEMYREQSTNGIRPEWKLVHGLAEMLAQAKRDAPEGAQIVLSEAVVSMVPVTEIVFEIGQHDKHNPEAMRMHTLTAYGFENHIPSNWNFLNWDRALLIFGGGLLLAITIIACLICYFR